MGSDQHLETSVQPFSIPCTCSTLRSLEDVETGDFFNPMISFCKTFICSNQGKVISRCIVSILNSGNCGNSESNPWKPKQLHEFLHGRKFFQSQNSWQRRSGIALSPADLKRCWNPTCYENNCHHQTYGISVSTIMCI